MKPDPSSSQWWGGAQGIQMRVRTICVPEPETDIVIGRLNREAMRCFLPLEPLRRGYVKVSLTPAGEHLRTSQSVIQTFQSTALPKIKI